MTRAPSPEQTILKLLTGRSVTRGLGVVAELGIADLLRDGPRTVEALAEATGTHVEALYRLLRALAAMDVFTESAGRTFAATPLAETLRSDAPRSLRGMARWLGAEPRHWAAWGDLDRCVRTGEPAIEDVFAYFAANPAASEIFDAAMSSLSTTAARAVRDAYDFSTIGHLVDVGGGHGTLLLMICAAYPDLRATLFDMPHVIERASDALAATGQAGRIALVEGSFFEAVPAADAHILKHILHDWSDELAVAILQRCRAALEPGGRVLVVEHLIGDGSEAAVTKWVDIEMLVMTRGGRERTVDEFAALFARAGLRLARTIPTRALVTILEAVVAD